RRPPSHQRSVPGPPGEGAARGGCIPGCSAAVSGVRRLNRAVQCGPGLVDRSALMSRPGARWTAQLEGYRGIDRTILSPIDLSIPIALRPTELPEVSAW